MGTACTRASITDFTSDVEQHSVKTHVPALQGSQQLLGTCLHSRLVAKYELLLRHTKMPTKTPPVAMAATRRTTITPAAIAPPLAVLPFPFPVFPFPFPLVQLHPLTRSDRTMRLRVSYMHTHSQHAASTPTFDGDKRYCTIHCVFPCIKRDLFHNTLLLHHQVVVNVI